MSEKLVSTGKYKVVWDKQRKCYIREHDKVWLDANGFYELKSIVEYEDGKYIIHHINGNRSDNRLENLKLLTRSEHAKLHACYRDKEVNLRISNKMKGVPKSDETKLKMRIAKQTNPPRGMLGKHHSEETKQKMRNSNKQTWANKSDEEKLQWKQKLSDSCKGKPAPNKGIPMSQDAKDNLSNYWKNKYADGYMPPSLGRIFVTNEVENHQIKKEDLQKYLDMGYRLGMRRRKNDNE